ncbi:hypothetical protein ACJJTC_011113 [Scirpophaga incertulas]
MQSLGQTECDSIKFDHEDKMTKLQSGLSKLDLYVLGRFWIQALRTVLVGAKFCMIPVVHAAMKPEEIPKKPPPMKYKELPLYNSPHYEYKDYVADQEKCPEHKDKLLHNALIPYVREHRKIAEERICKTCNAIKKNFEDTSKLVESRKNEAKAYMRSPDNLQLRQGVVASGVLAGYLIGGGGGIPKRIIYLLSWRYHFITQLVGKNFSLRERLPCKDDMPPQPPPRKPLCPPKK